MSLMSITQKNFDQEVLQSDQPVLLDFWAPWCSPCNMFSPVIEEIAKNHPEIKVGKVNVDEEPQLAGQFGVMGIPSVFYLKNGRVVASSVGMQPKEKVEAMLK